MSESCTLISVFVASPGDVMEERTRLQLVINELNQPGGLAEQYGCTLRLLDWRDVVSGMGRPEKVILEQLPVKSWDVFVGVLWHRFGTPSGGRDPETGRFYDSGTEEEFRLAYCAWQKIGRPHILIYRRTASPPSVDDIDPEQLIKVKAFWREFSVDGEHPGLFQPYETPRDFERRVRSDLSKLLRRVIPHSHSLVSIDLPAPIEEDSSLDEVNDEFAPTSIEWTMYDKAAVYGFFSYYPVDDIDLADESQFLGKLRDWHLVCQVGERWFFTKVGTLLFGPVDRVLAYAYTDIQVDDKGAGLRNFYGYPLMRLLLELMNALKPLWSEVWEDPSERDSRGRPIEVGAYPETAIVEALVNFIRHYHDLI
jgi:hypothetical protein